MFQWRLQCVHKPASIGHLYRQYRYSSPRCLLHATSALLGMLVMHFASTVHTLFLRFLVTLWDLVRDVPIFLQQWTDPQKPWAEVLAYSKPPCCIRKSTQVNATKECHVVFSSSASAMKGTVTYSQRWFTVQNLNLTHIHVYGFFTEPPPFPNAAVAYSDCCHVLQWTSAWGWRVRLTMVWLLLQTGSLWYHPSCEQIRSARDTAEAWHWHNAFQTLHTTVLHPIFQCSFICFSWWCCLVCKVHPGMPHLTQGLHKSDWNTSITFPNQKTVLHNYIIQETSVWGKLYTCSVSRITV